MTGVPEFNTLLYEVDNRVALVTLNRPDKMNALSIELCSEMQRAFAIADADPDVRVVVNTGNTRAYSAGYDFGDSGPELDTLDGASRRLNHDLTFTYAPWNCSKPTIAMIDGYCLAGGLEFALMHDIRYCSNAASFAALEARFSAGVATLALPWVIGALSRELLYTGDSVNPDVALRLGLVNRVFPQEELRSEVMKVGKRISRVALAALQWYKRSVNQAYEVMGFQSALKYAVEAAAIVDSVGTPERQEFGRIRRESGLAEALEWRRQQFAAFE